MRVGLITGIFPPDIGGPATFISMLGAGLSERGHTVEVVTYSNLARPENGWPFRVTRVLRSSKLRRVRAVGAIVRLARRSDVLLANGLVEATTLANAIVRRPCAVKVVGDFAWERARNCGLTSQEFTAFQSATHARPVAQWQRRRTRCLNRAGAVIVPSESLRTVVAGWGVARPIHVIANGIDEAFVRAAEGANLDEIRRDAALPPRFLLYAGRLTNWKGCDTLIRLMPKVPADVALAIAGDGPERGALEAIAQRLDLVERVRFLPPVDRARTAALMRLASAFVLNSGYEGHPHVVLEAMAVGTPVAAADEGGTSELVRDGENGVLFDKDNSPQMHERLQRLLDDEPLRRRLIDGGRATAARFPWSTTLEQTEALLAQLAEGGT